MKQRGDTTVIAIGIGNATDPQELSNIASLKGANDSQVYQVGDYDALQTLNSLVAYVACGGTRCLPSHTLQYFTCKLHKMSLAIGSLVCVCDDFNDFFKPMKQSSVGYIIFNVFLKEFIVLVIYNCKNKFIYSQHSLVFFIADGFVHLCGQ